MTKEEMERKARHDENNRKQLELLKAEIEKRKKEQK